MIDYDQAQLKDIAIAPRPDHVVVVDRRQMVLVPLDVLRRVTREFDVDHVREELRGVRGGRRCR